MANSGIAWIDNIFNWCVYILYEAARTLGITYEEINVWLFVVILPFLLSASIFLNIWQAANRRRGR